jgi:Glycosyltransferase
MRVKYCGPAKDYSGYGEANRHDIGALHAAGIELTTQIPVYVMELSDYGRLGELAGRFENQPLGYRIKILHTTPNVYKQFYEGGKYHIGRVFWETNKLPLDFAINCQYLDEIWTGSQFNANAIRNAGVTKPIYIIPEAIDTDVPPIEPYIVTNKNDYKFYSIFEWTERKNPLGLLEAFWREFENDKDVSLTLKTYLVGFGADKREPINQQIKKLKARLNLKHYAPVYLYRQLMDRHQIYRFHASFDCFVSAHRGEGWGVPQMEALLMKKPIISTNCGGIHEYLEHKKSAYLLPYTLQPLGEVTYNKQWYTPDQQWAEVKIDDIREALRFAYDNREDMQKMGAEGQKVVNSKFSLAAVGKMMSDRIAEITNKVLLGEI